ncbi:zinc-binding dehydrogenase [Aquabacterium sp. J223]|uniref:zinc-binding dehydrogenase n=1 Tax=Aquabacterium sp. J223 TaxID=2898431 RepID=UPI0021AD8186|nr:zinc-binding dehydrogenase [Aquabacterium sp. J223]UUX94568.1 zinc-binding dehydrogenase [Aquabacterium sp. J223]
MNHSVLVRAHGDASVMRYETTALPRPGPHEVLVRQEAVGVNFVDTMVRTGAFPAPLPTVLGFEAAGVVAAAGPETAFQAGERVGYFFAPNAYADFNVVDASALVRLPDDITTRQAAAFLAKGLTAWMGLRALHPLKAGDSILVQGASGSVGSVLVRWARHLGATVIGVAGSAQKLPGVARASSLALVASDPYLVDKVRALKPHGVDAVYDFVGEASFPSSLAAVRDGGSILTIGAASGAPRPDRQELVRRAISIRGGGAPQYVTPANQAAASGELFAAVRAGIFDDVDIVRHPLEGASAVHAAIDARRLTGLPVLVPRHVGDHTGA